MRALWIWKHSEKFQKLCCVCVKERDAEGGKIRLLTCAGGALAEEIEEWK